ncbi:MAG TPA: putative quinol monooxygenase [Lacipirellulaceae bacterium]|nr:putative quinol monooxygenase [Lacipirellulaceae bacterium]
MIHVIATIRAVPSRRDELLAVFRDLIPTVRSEGGCIEYGPAVDLGDVVEGQSAARPDTVTVVEKWQDVASLRQHLASPHMRRFRETVKELVSALEIRVLEPAEGIS